VVILGSGVKLGRAQEKARQFIEKLKFPVALTWATLDMFTHDYYLNAGGFGITSPRYGNFTIQNSDLIIALGTRLDTHATGSPLAAFAREAKKIILDIDESELLKFGKYGMKDALLINEDINDFLDKSGAQILFGLILISLIFNISIFGYIITPVIRLISTIFNVPLL